MNKACPKDNFPTLFIDQILDECVGSGFFLLWTDFHDTTRFKLSSRINIRKHLFVLGVLSHTRKFLSALKTPEKPFDEP
jgi:hypothetical protein